MFAVLVLHVIKSVAINIAYIGHFYARVSGSNIWVFFADGVGTRECDRFICSMFNGVKK